MQELVGDECCELVEAGLAIRVEPLNRRVHRTKEQQSQQRQFASSCTLDGFAIIYWFYEQIWRLAHGRSPDEALSVLAAYRAVDARSRSMLKKRPER